MLLNIFSELIDHLYIFFGEMSIQVIYSFLKLDCLSISLYLSFIIYLKQVSYRQQLGLVCFIQSVFQLVYLDYSHFKCFLIKLD